MPPMPKLGKILSATLGLAIAIVTLGNSLPSAAADSIVLRYMAHRRSVSVDELTTLAETGEVSRPLQVYLRQANRDPEELRRWLTEEIEISPIVLDRALNNPLGNLVLDQVSQTIYTPSQRADRQALRGALILSASDDSKLSLLEVLRNYPTSEVHVDGDRLADTFNRLKALEQTIGPWLNRSNRIYRSLTRS